MKKRVVGSEFVVSWMIVVGNCCLWTVTPDRKRRRSFIALCNALFMSMPKQRMFFSASERK